LTSNADDDGLLLPDGYGKRRSHLAGFWGKEYRPSGGYLRSLRVTRGFMPTIGLLAALAPAMAHAQTNLDQGKSASQIFSAACAECHKAPQGLAKGKSASTVADFLREHYTTNRDQAAALAAYVVGGRDTIAAPAPGKKPPAESPKTPAAAEETKPPKHQAQKPPKPGEGASANTKPQRPTDADAKPKEEASPGEVPSALNPIVRPERGPHERPGTATRNRRKEQQIPEPPQEPAAVAHAPAAIVAEPGRPEAPPQDAAPTPNAAAPADSTPGEAGDNAQVPRDNIPD
jgi:hypothetical protein